MRDQKPDLLVDLTLFHASYGRPQVTQHILSRNEKLAISYHNISPTEIYVKDNAEFAVGLEWGRYELSLLRDRVELSFADSQFNLKDLEQYGYTPDDQAQTAIREVVTSLYQRNSSFWKTRRTQSQVWN